MVIGNFLLVESLERFCVVLHCSDNVVTHGKLTDVGEIRLDFFQVQVF